MAECSNKNKFILKGPEQVPRKHEGGLGAELFATLKKNKDKIVQICTETGVKDAGGDLLERSIRTALEMKKRGITQEDVISICSYNHLNSVVPFLATLFLNSKIACLDPTISVEDTKHLVNQTKPKMIFIGEEAENLISEVLEDASFEAEVITFGNSSKYERFINFLKEKPDEEEFKPVIPKNLRETSVIFFSSGTTGLPKGICLSHHSLLNRLPNDETIANLQNGALSFASHYWISTLMALFFTLKSGVPRLLIPKFDPGKAWEAVDVFKPAFFFAAPSQLLEMLGKEGIPEGKDVSSIQLLFLGGHSVGVDNLDYIRTLFPKALVLDGYGVTETCGGLLHFNLNDMDGWKIALEKRGSCGTVVPGIEYKVVDIESEELCGPYQNGELRVKSDFFMNGYYGIDASSAWDEEGWLKTGDVVYYDEDKYFFIVDRVKEMLKYKSWHVPPAKLEMALTQHPDVINAVVVGLPHPLDGDHPCGVVTLREGATVTAEELKDFADSQLDDRQKLRGGVRIIKSFPKTPTGKFKRLQIRDNVLNGVY